MMRSIMVYLAGLVAAIFCSIGLARADCLAPLLGGEAPRFEVDKQICQQGFTIGYSARLRSPLWSAERLTPKQLQEADESSRDCSIRASRAVADGATNSDYLRSGYDRGHMTPAGDFGLGQQLTCTLANMVPQVPDLNRKVWRAIEQQTREQAASLGGAYVITGPIYPGSPRYLFERVPVPESVYKVVVTAVGAWAYVASNHRPIRCRLISIARFEAERGVRIVPALDDDRRQRSWMPSPVKGCERWEGH